MNFFSGLTERQVREMAPFDCSRSAVLQAQRWAMVAHLAVLSLTVIFASLLYSWLAGTVDFFALGALFLLGSGAAMPLAWLDDKLPKYAARKTLERLSA